MPLSVRKVSGGVNGKSDIYIRGWLLVRLIPSLRCCWKGHTAWQGGKTVEMAAEVIELNERGQDGAGLAPAHMTLQKVRRRISRTCT